MLGYYQIHNCGVETPRSRLGTVLYLYSEANAAASERSLQLTDRQQMSFVMEDTETHNDSMRRVRKRFWREHSQVLPA